MVENQKITPKQMLVSDSSTSYTDAVKTSVRSDGSILMQFVSDTPDYQVENHRTVMGNDLVKKLIENLCMITDHYPKKKPGPKPKTSKKK